MENFEEQRMIDAEPIIGDKVDIAVRPDSIDEFIGQETLRENLKIFIQAAKNRGMALDHVLFNGPPGLGKTTLAQIVSKELGVNFKSTSGPIIEKAGDLAAILTSLQEGDVLFIDEIHRLPTQVEEVLYPAMEDYQLDIIIGEGPAARTVKIDLPPFTLVGATTRAGMLSNPLRDRFGVQLRLEFYSSEELTRVVQRAANKHGYDIEPEGAFEIARRSRGTPRVAGRLLRRVSDFATVKGNGHIDREIADIALKALEIDERGLDKNDHRFLNIVMDNFAGGPVGLDTIAAAIGESRDTIEDVIEPFLIQQGFLQRTPRGRLILPAAYKHMNKPLPNNHPSQASLL